MNFRFFMGFEFNQLESLDRAYLSENSLATLIDNVYVIELGALRSDSLSIGAVEFILTQHIESAVESAVQNYQDAVSMGQY